MRVLMIDVDGRLPNLAFMKLSTWHKQAGDEVFLNSCPVPDKVYIASLFTWNRDKVNALLGRYPRATVGGTGWDIHISLAEEIEKCRPDYSLYTVEDVYKRICRGIRTKEKSLQKAHEIVTAGLGFTTRGCIRTNCHFCIVREKEGQLRQDSTIEEIINPASNRIVLYDNNFVADPNCIEKLHEIRDRGLIVDFSQGLDARLLSPEIVKALSEVKHWRSLHTAWDKLRSENSVMEGIRLLTERFSPKKLMCFVLCGYSTTFEEDIYRFRRLVEKNIDPFIMLFDNSHEPKLRHFARWVNSRIYKVCPNFEDYEPWRKARPLYERQLALC